VVTNKEIRIYSEAHRYGHGRERGPADLHDEPLMPKTPSRKLKQPLTPAGFRRLIAKEIALVKSRPTTAAEAQDQLGAYYRISQIVNRLQSDRAAYGDRQFTEFAAAVGYHGLPIGA